MSLFDLGKLPLIPIPRILYDKNSITRRATLNNLILKESIFKGFILPEYNPINYRDDEISVKVGRNFTWDEWYIRTGNPEYKKMFHQLPIHTSVFSPMIKFSESNLKLGKKQYSSEILGKLKKWAIELNDAYQMNEVARAAANQSFPDLSLELSEIAVSLDSLNGNYRDTKGVGLVLLGKYEEAIIEFERFIEWAANDKYYARFIESREKWIELLKQGKNPFDKHLIE